MKLIGNNSKLKTSQRRHKLRDIVDNHSKRLLLDGIQNETIIIPERNDKDSN